MTVYFNTWRRLRAEITRRIQLTLFLSLSSLSLTHAILVHYNYSIRNMFTSTLVVDDFAIYADLSTHELNWIFFSLPFYLPFLQWYFNVYKEKNLTKKLKKKIKLHVLRPFIHFTSILLPFELKLKFKYGEQMKTGERSGKSGKWQCEYL